MGEKCGAICPTDPTKTCLESKSDLYHANHKAWKDENEVEEELWPNLSAPEHPLAQRGGRRKGGLTPDMQALGDKITDEVRGGRNGEVQPEPEPEPERPLRDPIEIRPGLYGDDSTDTQFDAAMSFSGKRGQDRLRVLHQLSSDDCVEGWTDAELEVRLGMHYSLFGPRRRELDAGGWVRDSGRRRQTPLGKSAIVWELTRAAVAHLAQTSLPDLDDEPEPESELEPPHPQPLVHVLRDFG